MRQNKREKLPKIKINNFDDISGAVWMLTEGSILVARVENVRDN